MPISGRGGRLPIAKREKALEKTSLSLAAGIAGDERRRERGHRTPSPHGTTRHYRIPPLLALGGLFIALANAIP
jgi:hypothetical protein